MVWTAAKERIMYVSVEENGIRWSGRSDGIRGGGLHRADIIQNVSGTAPHRKNVRKHSSDTRRILRALSTNSILHRLMIV